MYCLCVNGDLSYSFLQPKFPCLLEEDNIFSLKSKQTKKSSQRLHFKVYLLTCKFTVVNDSHVCYKTGLSNTDVFWI